MALRQGLRGLSNALLASKNAMPLRGGGGGPVKMAPAPDKPIPLWEEMWWDDGQVHSQPCLDGVGEPTFQTPGEAVGQLFIGLGFLAATVATAFAVFDPKTDRTYVQHQYPPETMETFTSRNKIQGEKVGVPRQTTWTGAPQQA